MNMLKDEIGKIAEEAIQLYSMETQRAYIEDKKKENSLTKQYKGREVYELLQNIDDAADEKKDCIASIILDGEYLTVSNNGHPFTISTLQRLCQGGVSEKNDQYIGCKGIGFRSVLNWSDDIEIYSGEGTDYISVRFSRSHAELQLQSLLNEASENIKKHLNKQIDELKSKGIDSSYPIFRAPEPIEPIDKNFDTVIKLKIKDGIKKDIINSLNDIDRYRYILLFLPHLIQINFCDKDNKSYLEFTKTVEENKVQLTIPCVEGTKTTEVFLFFHQNDKLDKKYSGSDKVSMGVAIPCNHRDVNEPRLYTFFPILDLKSPFPALLHATFFLTDNRNDLDLNSEETKEANKEIFKRLLHFYVEKVVNNFDKEERLRLLLPFTMPSNCYDQFFFNESLAKLNLEDEFINTCKEYELFYTVNDEYKKGDDYPIVLGSFPENEKLFAGEHFSRLVTHIHDGKERGFAKRLIGNNNDNDTERYLCNAINKVSGDWNVSERISTFKWWHSQNYTLLPNLLKTIDDKFLVNNNEPCFLPEDIVPDWVKNIPEWAIISILHEDDLRELLSVFSKEIEEIKKASESSKRVLARIINKQLVDIQEQSSRQMVISPVNTSVNGNYFHAVEFMKWLWQVWDESRFDDTIKNKISFVVPTKDRQVSEAKNVYMGESYGNKLGAMIFEKIGKYDKYHELEIINFQPFDDSKRAFLQDLGVLKFPRLRLDKEAKPLNEDLETKKKFVDYVLKKHPLPSGQDKVRVYNTLFYSIDNIEDFLQNLDTKTVISWIFGDLELKNAIRNDVQPKKCCIEYKLNNKWYPRRHNNEWQLPSYIRFVFSNVKWIEIGGKKYSPSELIITNNDYLNSFNLNCISENDIEDFAKDIPSKDGKDELRQLLIILGAKTSYLELDPEEFYGLLLALPSGDEDKAKKISKELYRTIIDSSPIISKYESLYNTKTDKRVEFEENGQVLVKKNGGSSFEPIKNAFFSSSAVINIDEKYPIDVPTRRGKREDFQNILCIQPFEISYSVLTENVSDCNADFQKELESYIPCIMAYRKGKKDEVLNLTIELVSKAEINYEGKTNRITSGYTLLKKANRHWLICVGEETEYNKLEKELIADNLVQIFNVLFNFPSKEFLNKVEQLFIYSQRQREHYIEDELGSVDEIELAKQEINQSRDFYEKLEKFFNSNQGLKVSDIIKQINWNNLSILDQENVIKLLAQSGRTLEDLNKEIERTISVVPYNKSVLANQYKIDRLKVHSDIYAAIITFGKQKELTSKWKEFEDWVMSYNEGFESIDFDGEDVYKKLKNEFYKRNNIAENDSIKYEDIKTKYDKNLQNLKMLFVNTDLSLNDFTNNPYNNSLLFFEEDNLEEIVKEFIRNESTKADGEKQTENNNIALYSLIKNAEIQNDLSSGIAMSSGNSDSNKGAVTRTKKEKTERKNKRQGNIAEYIVVHKLVEKAIQEVISFFNNSDYSIHWVSGAAKDIQTTSDDKHQYDCSMTDDGAGYDIKLVSKGEDKTMYIEVKSSSSENCSFYMSLNEYNFAKSKNTINEQYRIVFVSNINVNDSNSVPKIAFIDASLEDAFNSYAIQYNMIYNKEKKCSKTPKSR